ncbi:MAG: cell division protein ZapA [Gammaproteobacteria bacterium]|jgi:cell division protein ZapA|nr:cell division protein ZapA [Gammaproteobacteria bacterium]
MADASVSTVSIRVLDKDYQVHCPPEQQDALLSAAHGLDLRMREIRRSGNVIGLERIAVMAALNLSYELMQAQHNAGSSAAASTDLDRIDAKLTQAILALE